MNIYFCGAIAGGRDHLTVYRHIVSRLQADGHTVPTQHVASPDVLHEEQAFTPRAVYERDQAWLQRAEVMIAEISTPSLGVGYEIALGLQLGKPVLCLYREGLSISKMITGNPAPTLQVHAYGNLSDLDRHIDRFLAGLAASKI